MGNENQELYLPEDAELLKESKSVDTSTGEAEAKRMHKLLNFQIDAILRSRKTSHDLKESITTFSESSDRYSRRLIFLTWILIVFTVALVVMTGVLIVDGRRAVSTENNIALTSQFFDNADTQIINDIENNKPILVEDHGQFTDAQLDNYLGNFDTVQSSYDNGLLSESDLCDSFSYYVKITSQNGEIQQYIAEQDKLYPGSMTSVAYLANFVSKSKDANCK